MGSKPNWGRGASALGDMLFRYAMAQDRQKFIEEERRQRETAWDARDEARRSADRTEWDRQRGVTSAEKQAGWDRDDLYRDEVLGLRERGLDLQERGIDLREALGQSSDQGTDPITTDATFPDRISVNDAIKTYMPPDKTHTYKGEDEPTTEYVGGSLLSAPAKQRLFESGALPSNTPQLFASGFRDSTKTGRWDTGTPTAEAVLGDIIDESFDPSGLDISDKWKFREGVDGAPGAMYYDRPMWGDKHLAVMEFVRQEIAPKIGDVGSRGIRDQMINMSMLKKYGIDLEDYLAAKEDGAVDAAIAEEKMKANSDYLNLAR